jgi:hypothetical protein
MQPKLGKWAMPKEIFCNTPPSLILSNTVLIKIDPRRKEFTTILVLALSVGNVVAQGITCACNYVAKNCKFAAPSEEKPPSQHTTINDDDDKSSSEVTRCNK